LTAVKDTARIKVKFIRRYRSRGAAMSPTEEASQRQASYERIPPMQRILDNPFLLLFLGVTIPTVLYLIWGVMEVASIPLAK
jgi:hypothetical protein